MIDGAPPCKVLRYIKPSEGHNTMDNPAPIGTLATSNELFTR